MVKKTATVSLDPEWDAWIQEMKKEGHFTGRSNAVNRALALLKQNLELRALVEDPRIAAHIVRIAAHYKAQDERMAAAVSGFGEDQPVMGPEGASSPPRPESRRARPK